MLVQPFIPFLLFVLALYATPGPNTLSIAASGAAFGLKRTIPYILGILTGMVSIILASAFGLGLVFQTYPLLRSIFEWVSLGYIIFLSVRIARADARSKEVIGRFTYLDGLIICSLNPKAYFAILATVSQFYHGGTQELLVMLAWLVILLVIINIFWATIGAAIKPKPGTTAARVVNICFAVLLFSSVVITMLVAK